MYCVFISVLFLEAHVIPELYLIEYNLNYNSVIYRIIDSNYVIFKRKKIPNHLVENNLAFKKY